MAAAEASHLSQEELSVTDKAILAGITDWLNNAEFDPTTNVCTDKGLGEIWSKLCEMKFIQQVISELTSIYYQ